MNIVYNYHVHDGDGTYESTCYSAIYHTHVSACKIVCNGTMVFTADGTQSGSSWKGPVKCQRCGMTATISACATQPHKGETLTRSKCWNVIGYSCGYSNGDLEKYDIVW